jgi:hypothetical protein
MDAMTWRQLLPPAASALLLHYGLPQTRLTRARPYTGASLQVAAVLLATGAPGRVWAGFVVTALLVALMHLRDRAAAKRRWLTTYEPSSVRQPISSLSYEHLSDGALVC